MKLTMATLLSPALLVAFTVCGGGGNSEPPDAILEFDQEHNFGVPIGAGGHDELGPGPVQERQGRQRRDGRAVAYHRYSFRTLRRKIL